MNLCQCSKDSKDCTEKCKNNCQQNYEKILKESIIEKVVSVHKYRSNVNVNQDYNRARVILDLKFPEDLKLYNIIKSKIN